MSLLIAVSVALLVISAMSFQMSRLYGQLAGLNRLVAAMLRSPERAGDLADAYARSRGWDGP